MLTFDDLAGGAASLEPPGGLPGADSVGAAGAAGGVRAVRAGRRRHSRRAVSALRMIGRPSLPAPMMMIFEFCDCASIRVASMPRQRR